MRGRGKLRGEGTHTRHYESDDEERHEGAFGIMHVIAETRPFFGFAADSVFVSWFPAGRKEGASVGVGEVVEEVS